MEGGDEGEPPMPSSASQDWEQEAAYAQEAAAADIIEPEWPEEADEFHRTVCRDWWREWCLNQLSQQYQDHELRTVVQGMVDDMNSPEPQHQTVYMVWMRALQESILVDEETREDNIAYRHFLMQFYQRHIDEAATEEDLVVDAWVAEVFCKYYDYPEALQAYLIEAYPSDLSGKRTAPDADMFYLNGRYARMKAKTRGEEEAGEEGGEVEGGEGEGEEEERESSKEDESSSTEAASVGKGRQVGRQRVLRSQWLGENARVAAHLNKGHGGGLRKMAQELGLSPGFRLYIGGWLWVAACFSLVLAFHFGTVLLSRMFVPLTGGFIATASLVVCFILFVPFVGSWLTVVQRVVEQWGRMDDKVYFGDKDFSLDIEAKSRSRDKEPCPPNKYGPAEDHDEMVCSLPPTYTRTIMMLPTRAMRRETWLGILFLLTTVVPFFFAIGFAFAVKAGTMYMVCTFFVYNMTLVMCLLVVYWLYMWYYGMRRKYRAYKKWSKVNRDEKKNKGRRDDDDDSEEDDKGTREYNAMLAEFAMDERSIIRNLILVLACFLPFLILFLFVSSPNVDIAPEWAVSAMAVILMLFATREVMRSSTMKKWVPLVVMIMLLIMLIIGIAGAAQMGGGAIGVFLTLGAMSQMFCVRYRRDTSEYDPSAAVADMLTAVTRFEDRLGVKVMEMEDRDKLQELSPRHAKKSQDVKRSVMSDASEGAVRRMIGSVRDNYDATIGADKPRREPSLIPCYHTLRVAFTAIRCCKVCRGGRKLPDAGRQHDLSYPWAPTDPYIADESTDPEEKLIQSVSPRAIVWFYLIFIILLAVMFSVRDGLMNESRTGAAENAVSQTGSGAMTKHGYPVCRMQWKNALNFGIVDFAMLADLSYASIPCGDESVGGACIPTLFPRTETANNVFATEFAEYFGHTDLRMVVSKADHTFPDEDFSQKKGPGVHWLHFYSPREKQHIIVLRSMLEGSHLIGRDLDIWGDSIAAQVVSALVPGFRWFSDGMMSDFVRGLAFVKDAFDGDEEDYLQPLVSYINRLKGGTLQLVADPVGIVRNNTGDKATEPTNLEWGEVTFVGHGTNGGIAKILGARFNAQTVTFNAPGTKWLGKKMEFTEHNPRETSVVPTHDIMTWIDSQTGGVQYIGCGVKSIPGM
eukprot:Hpha_TRINITY_DN16080_c0_g2::TRINITY_DN16080_c0_g2_i1::g.121447::m.121447